MQQTQVELLQILKIKLQKKFEIQELGNIKYYLGIEVTKDDNGDYYLRQSKYIKKVINKFELKDAKISSVPMETSYIRTRQDTIRDFY